MGDAEPADEADNPYDGAAADATDLDVPFWHIPSLSSNWGEGRKSGLPDW